MRPTASSRRTRAACAAASTSVPGSSPARGCSCSTNRRPASTPPTGSTSGPTCATWSNEGATILLTTQYLEEADQLASDVVVIDHGCVHRPRHPARAEAAPRRRRARRHRRRRGPRPGRRLITDIGSGRRPSTGYPARAVPGRRRGREPGRRWSAASTRPASRSSTSPPPPVARRRVPHAHRSHDRLRHRRRDPPGGLLMTATTVPTMTVAPDAVVSNRLPRGRRAQRRVGDRGTQRQAPVADAAAPGGERRPDGDVPPACSATCSADRSRSPT